MSRTIEVPAGSDMRLCTQGGWHFVLVASPPLQADVAMFRRPGVSGLFTFDPGLTWPDRDACRAASAYLKAKHPIAFCFERLGDALVFRKRLGEPAPAVANDR